jgi:riboflavin kinase/FMN adenylyltransferase
MRVVRSLDRARGLFRRPVLTIGNFDGVHRGHQVILSQVREEAARLGVPAVALTFEPHPVAVLRPDKAPRLLMTLRDRLAALAGCGIDSVVVQRFGAAFAEIEAEEFIRRFLVDTLDAQKLVVGHDLNFGRGRRGDIDLLVESGGRYGFAVEIIRPVVADSRIVHSSVVRAKVAAGDVETAARLLGRPHFVRGRVVHGAGRGKGLGVATANLRPRPPAVPGDGVYATRSLVGARRIDGVTSIGSAPTFDGQETVIETHLFTEPEDFYGRVLTLEFHARLRNQQKFPTPAALVAQIQRDVDQAKEILAAV